ncbi:hypothetical protein GF386_02765 [Candidatus Pacearchaeota archaeon]|nr:hypothetical protein [Candidatus Pacearchaeota archaeon]MBD3283070.1 hypothetical protein [Candidatus Pacearchaeota archaeon]
MPLSEKRSVCKPVLVCSSIGFCATLEGAVIVGGSDDNTQLVGLLVGSEAKNP